MATPEKQDDPTDVRAHVRERYGRIAAEFAPAPEAAASCCGPSASNVVPVSQIYETPDASNLPGEVTGLSMGCGDPVTLASLRPGQTVLDLGSGGGIDCFLAAQRVGETGHVIGVDMTAQMLEKARANKAKLGVENVEFRLGEIEHLPVSDGTVDVIISNCVINLSPDKPQVFREAFRVLKPGGRLAVSDIVTNGPLPEMIRENLDAWAGCVAGAWNIKDYVDAIQRAGFEGVEFEPVYLDRSTIQAAAEQLDLGDTVTDDGRKLILMTDTEGAKVIDLDDSVDIDEESLRKSIFSAKITAYKPSTGS